MKKTVEINYLGASLTIVGNYEPAEKEERYDSNMEGYPGCDASFEVISVFAGSVELTEMLLDTQFEDIKELVLNNI